MKTAPEFIAVYYCNTCGRLDRNKFFNRHYSLGQICPGESVRLKYYRKHVLERDVSRETTPTGDNNTE